MGAGGVAGGPKASASPQPPLLGSRWLRVFSIEVKRGIEGPTYRLLAERPCSLDD